MWWELLLEMSLLSLMGVGYYFFQKRRYLKWLKNEPQVLAKDLFVFLLEEKAIPESTELSNLLIGLEDYLEQRRPSWPIEELKNLHTSLPSTIDSKAHKKLTMALDLAQKLYSSQP